MVAHSVIEAQLTRLGIRRTFFSRPEIRELQHILIDHEQIVRCGQGRYSGGFAILVATDLRLLLVDKKPLYLTVEDIRYDMISEVDISSSLIDATLTIYTVNKQLSFSAVRKHNLRNLAAYVQKRVMEFRQYHPNEPAPQPVQLPITWVQPAAIPQVTPASLTHQLAAHMPHLPHTRPHIPEHLSQAVGSAATRLASRLHNPNPYTKTPLRVRRLTVLPEPTPKELEAEIVG